MEKSNIFAPGNRRKINPDWFTGPVYMKDISSVIQSQGHDIYHVHFERGAKTKLHEHNGNQILIAVQGKGRLEFFKKTSKSTIKKTKSISLNNGDVAYIPKNTLHTHGSAEPKKTVLSYRNQYFANQEIAIQNGLVRIRFCKKCIRYCKVLDWLCLKGNLADHRVVDSQIVADFFDVSLCSLL